MCQWFTMTHWTYLRVNKEKDNGMSESANEVSSDTKGIKKVSLTQLAHGRNGAWDFPHDLQWSQEKTLVRFYNTMSIFHFKCIFAVVVPVICVIHNAFACFLNIWLGFVKVKMQEQPMLHIQYMAKYDL